MTGWQGSRFRQLAGTLQDYIDCPAPISEQEAAAVLESYKRTDTLLQNLRYWMSTLKVSVIVIDGTRKDADRLVADMDAARRR